MPRTRRASASTAVADLLLGWPRRQVRRARSLCWLARARLAIAAALTLLAASPAVRATEPDAGDELPLADLPGAAAPAPPAKKKHKGKNKKDEAPAGSDASGAFVAAPPPANALPEIPMLNLSTRIGVTLVRTPLLDESTTADVESGLRGIAFQAPMSQNPIVMRTALEVVCAPDDDPCFLARGAREGVDTVVVAVAEKRPSGVALRVRALAVLGQKRLSELSGEAPLDRLAIKAEAEGLLCKLLVPTGCSSEIEIDAGQAELLYDGRVLPKGNTIPMHLTLPVGLAPLSAREGGRTGPVRLFPVLREKSVGIALTVRASSDGVPQLATLAELDHPPVPVLAVSSSSEPSRRIGWNKPAGFGVAGAGAVLLAVGIVEGVHAKSLLNSAQSSYEAQGAWASSELPTLRSGNSAAHTANVLFIVGSIAAAAGLAFALTF